MLQVAILAGRTACQADRIDQPGARGYLVLPRRSHLADDHRLEPSHRQDDGRVLDVFAQLCCQRFCGALHGESSHLHRAKRFVPEQHRAVRLD